MEQVDPKTLLPKITRVFNAAMEHCQEGLSVTDSNGEFLYLNQSHVQLFGYDSVSELVGRSWRVLYTESNVKFIESDVFPQLVAEGRWSGLLKAKRRDGSLFDEELSLNLLPNGGIVCNCRDVTAQIESQAQLRQSEELFRKFLNSLPLGVMIRRTMGDYSFVNDVVTSFLGNGNLTGKKSDYVYWCISDNENFRPWAEAERRVMQRGKSEQFDFSINWGGQDWILDVIKLPLRVKSEKISHICTLVSDVTATRKLQLDRDDNLRKSAEYLVMQREFISMVSHEFRTPLTAIQGTHYLMSSELSKAFPSQQADMAKFLELQGSALNTLKELVDQVLLLNRLDQTSSETPTQNLSLEEFVTRIISVFESSSAEDRIQLSINVPPDYTACFVPQHIKAVIENLVSNALKYSAPVTKVSISVWVEGSDWCLRVADKGRGISAEDQLMLFKPFHRASNVGTVPGTGLGLTIVNRAVTLHGGRVQVESEKNLGSCFTVFIPRDSIKGDQAFKEYAVNSSSIQLPPIKTL